MADEAVDEAGIEAPGAPRAMMGSRPLWAGPPQSDAAPKPTMPTMKVRVRPQ